MKAGLIGASVVVVVAGSLGATYIVFTDMINERLDQVTGINVAETVPRALDPKFRECEALADEVIEFMDDFIALLREEKSGEIQPLEAVKLSNELSVDMSILIERSYDLGCNTHDEGLAYSQYITTEQKKRMLEKGSIMESLGVDIE